MIRFLTTNDLSHVTLIPFVKIVHLYEPGRHRKPSSFSSTYRALHLIVGHSLYPFCVGYHCIWRVAELVKRYTWARYGPQTDSYLGICMEHGVLRFTICHCGT